MCCTAQLHVSSVGVSVGHVSCADCYTKIHSLCSSISKLMCSGSLGLSEGWWKTIARVNHLEERLLDQAQAWTPYTLF